MWASVLLFMLSLIGALAAAATAAFLVFRGNKRMALRLLVLLAVAGATYVLAIIVVAVSSDRQLIALGGEKHICEIDCHVAYSVLGVDTVRELGSTRPADGNEFHVITVRTRFDRSTISNRRSLDMPLFPGARNIRIYDAQGNTYAVSAAGQAALGQPAPSPNMLTRSMKPGDEFIAKLVFELPRGALSPTLLIQDTDFTKWVLIGSETFPLHAKALFRLDGGPGVKDVAAD